jgi:hypothetical protein
MPLGIVSSPRLPLSFDVVLQPRGHISINKYYAGFKRSPYGLQLPVSFRPWADGPNVTAPVGSFNPNKFGLYDMHGHVWQWVEDCYADDLNGAPTDGAAWREACKDETSFHVVRGGSWSFGPDGIRSFDTGRIETGGRLILVGFGVARVLPPARTLLPP